MPHYNHLDEARCMFVHGPVAVYICTASEDEITAALRAVTRLAYIAARLLNEETKSCPSTSTSETKVSESRSDP